MKQQDDNLVLVKSKAFAIRCIRLRQHLMKVSHEYVMSKQILKSGTSIGANVKEAIRGQSRADFGTKMNIALKEASETEYWIEFLTETDYITQEQGESLLEDCRELIRLLTSIVKAIFDPDEA